MQEGDRRLEGLDSVNLGQSRYVDWGLDAKEDLHVICLAPSFVGDVDGQPTTACLSGSGCEGGNEVRGDRYFEPGSAHSIEQQWSEQRRQNSQQRGNGSQLRPQVAPILDDNLVGKSDHCAI